MEIAQRILSHIWICEGSGPGEDFFMRLGCNHHSLVNMDVWTGLLRDHSRGSKIAAAADVID